MSWVFDIDDKQRDLLFKFDQIKEKGLYPIGVIAKKYNGSLFGKVIQFFQNNEYIHVEFLLNDNKTTFGSRPTRGVNFYQITDSYLDIENNNIDIFLFCEDDNEYTFTNKQINKFYEILDHIIIKSKIRYDAIGVLSVIINSFKQDKNSYYCSELVYDVMDFCEFPLLNNIPRKQDSIVYPSTIISSIRLMESVELLEYIKRT